MDGLGFSEMVAGVVIRLPILFRRGELLYLLAAEEDEMLMFSPFTAQ